MDVNLTIPLRFCRTVLLHMVNQRSGRIVNIASIAGRQPRPTHVVYSAAKAGVIAMSRSVAVAMAPYNIRINCVCPGTIETSAIEQLRSDGKYDYIGGILKDDTLGILGQTKEVVALVRFLVSDESSYIVG